MAKCIAKCPVCGESPHSDVRRLEDELAAAREECDHYRRGLVDRLTRSLNNWSDACREAEEAGLPEKGPWPNQLAHKHDCNLLEAESLFEVLTGQRRAEPSAMIAWEQAQAALAATEEEDGLRRDALGRMDMLVAL
jgi:hypothetical protein